jgi:CubicO group peptidase (beta-lactamase class C family)
MALDDFQQAWQTHSSETRVTIDADLLLNQVQRNQRDFRALIFRRDCREIGVALLLLPAWIYMGVTMPLPWTWYLMVPALIWIAGFILVYRLLHKQDPVQPEEALLPCVERSLTEVDDQIWLLRRVFWWYLLPPAIPMLAFTAHVSWLKARDWLDVFSDVNAIVFVFFVAIFYFLYYINQRAVDLDLEPRRQELLKLRASLRDESFGEFAMTDHREEVKCARSFERWYIVAVSCFVTLMVIALAVGLFDSIYDQPPRSSGPLGESLAELITHERKEKNLVGLAALVMVDGKVEAAAAQGERKIGSDMPLEIGDSWHVGGITKSITATMIARLVESGQMKWSDTVGESFSDASIDESWKPVTLRQLLTDTAGAPANFPRDIWYERPPLGLERIQARRKRVLDVMAKNTERTPGESYEYSNVGCTIAAAMAEKLTGESWEDLVKREVFEPLKLSSAGFGPPTSPDETLPQPRGHRSSLGRKLAMDDDADNSPIMGPSGTVRMTLSDLCAYATDHLRGDLGKGQLLSAETYKLLHAPELSYYAFGWIKKEPSQEVPHTVYWHNGSNTMWYSLVVFIPDKKMVIAVTSNDGDFYSAEAAAWEIVKASANQFKFEGNAERRSLSSEAFPRKSPFAAVRWQDSQPEVQLDDEWFKLVSLDELPADDIIAFSRKTYGDLWQKRFEEDLVELLSRMGHPPQDTVTLVVQSLTTSQTRTVEEVPMTEANRQAIKAAAMARERSEQPRTTRPAVPIEDAALFRTRVDEFLNAARTKAGFSGAVIVARSGQPVYQGAFGFSHLESNERNTVDTPFRIASLSKQFTAAAIFRLEGQGKLYIDDPVHQYLPEFAEAPYRDIAIHHLLTHTSGLPRIASGFLGGIRWIRMSRAATPVDDFVRLAVETPLEFAPGTDFQYSNFSFRVLSALIGRVTGREYADFMEQEVFQPLGMNDTGVARVTRPPSEARIAEGLTLLKLDRAGEPLFANGEEGRNFGVGYGSGGIYTSANDLLRWDRVLAGDEFLTESQKARLFQPIHDYYACGWTVKKSGLDGRLYHMHGGANEGFFSQMMRLPEDDLVIIAVGNVKATSSIDDVLEQLFRLCRSLSYRDP